MASTGSTGGGIKLFRTLVMLKQWLRESFALVHPHAVLPLKIAGQVVSNRVVNSVLALINYYTNGFAYMWFLWSVFGWGIGLIFHALNTFDLNPFCGKQWEKRKMEEFMNEYDESENGNDHGRFQ